MERKGNILLKKTVLAGLFSALSVVLITFVRIPFPPAPFLVFDAGDVPILMSGFLLGPWWGLGVTVVASLVQAFVFSGDGLVGGLMHIIASGVFVLVSSLIYKKWHTFRGALIGLAVGGVAMIAAMIPANLYITSAYYNMTVEQVGAMIIPAVLPYNAIKAVINIIVQLLVYKPVSKGLHKVSWL